IETATISVALPASFRRMASSTAISSKGFIDILMLASSTPEPSGLTRILTLKSTTRFTGTKIFMFSHPGGRLSSAGGGYRPPRWPVNAYAAPHAANSTSPESPLLPGQCHLALLPRRPQNDRRPLVVGIATG